jgi:hypothetical protein
VVEHLHKALQIKIRFLETISTLLME